MSLSWPWLRRIGAAALLVAIAIVVGRLAYLPSSVALVGADQNWDVSAGHRLDLVGPDAADLLQIETGAGDGAQVAAGPATLAGGDGRPVRSLVWQVAGLDNPNGDNKVRVDVALAGPPDARAAVYVRRAGTRTRPELEIGSDNAPLAVTAGVEFGDVRFLPHATLNADGRIQDNSLRAGFTIAPGGALRLTFPVFPDGTPKGMTIELGQDEPIGPRLWLRRAGITADGDGGPWKAACAARSGRQLWPMLTRARQVFHDDDCAPGHVLAATGLEIGHDDKITLSLAGSAYVVDKRQPINSRLLNLIKANPFLMVVMGGLFAAASGWLLKELGGAKPSPAPEPASPPEPAATRPRRPRRSKRAPEVPADQPPEPPGPRTQSSRSTGSQPKT